MAYSPPTNINNPNVPPKDKVRWKGEDNRDKALHYKAENVPANMSLDKESAIVSKIMAEAQMHIAQAEAARANGESEVANAPLVRDLLRLVREREKEEEANEEDLDEIKYIEALRTDANTRKIGELISFVASFAAEDPHDLISPDAKISVRMSGPVTPGNQWEYYVSDRLEAHTREVVSMIQERYHETLGAATAYQFINADDPVQIRFHRAVASMYRGSSVFSVKRYSTTKAITTLQNNIAQHLRYFRYVRLKGGRLEVMPSRHHPLPRELYGI